jgi:hypothetical protein
MERTACCSVHAAMTSSTRIAIGEYKLPRAAAAAQHNAHTLRTPKHERGTVAATALWSFVIVN